MEKKMAKNLFDFGSEEIAEENKGSHNNKENFKQNSKSSLDENNNYNKDNNYKNKNFDSNNKSASNKENLTEEAKNLYEKYKDYSQTDLISEFLTTSKQKLNNGTLTQEKINNTANALLPFLNNDQKNMLSQILGKLNNE